MYTPCVRLARAPPLAVCEQCRWNRCRSLTAAVFPMKTQDISDSGNCHIVYLYHYHHYYYHYYYHLMSPRPLSRPLPSKAIRKRIYIYIYIYIYM